MGQLTNTPQREIPIRLEARKSYSLGIEFKTKMDAAYDLTGCSVKFDLAKRPHLGGQQLITARNFTIATPTTGEARLDLQAADLTLADGTYLYTITIYTAENYSSVVAQGELEIVGNQNTNALTYASAQPPGTITAILEANNVVKVTVNHMPPPRILIGTVSTTAAGTQATATMTGQYPTEYLNLTIPKGDQGIQGPQGDPGPAGPPGGGSLRYDVAQMLTTAQQRQTQTNQYGTVLWVTPEMYGAVGDGATDDTAAFNAALAASDHVKMSAKVYAFAGLITLQAGKTLSGMGGSDQGVNQSATCLKATNAAAQLWCRGAGFRIEGFNIDANNLATNPLVFGGAAGGDAGTSPSAEDITVMQAAAGGTSWKIYASQNGTITGCNILNGGGEGIWWDGHAGGWSVNRLEITGCATRNMRITDSGNLTFYKNLIERCMHTDNAPVLIEGSVWFPTIKFSETTFASGGVFATGGTHRALVDMRATGTLELESCQFGAILDEVAVRAGFAATAPIVHVTGSTYMTGASLYAFYDYDSTAIIDHEGETRGQVIGLGAGTVPLRTASSPVNNIGRFRQSGCTVYRSAASERADASLVNGNTFAQFERLIDGTMKWGTGTGAADVVLARNGVGSAFMTGSLQVSADMKATRYLHNRQDVTLVANSAPAIDLSLGSCIFLKLNGFNLTGLSFTNAVIGQEIVMLVKQGGTPSTVTLPGIASSFYWDEGDPNIPVVVAAASAWMALRFQVTDNGLYKETARNGWVKNVIFMSNGTKIISGTGSPEGAQTAPVGSLFLRTDGASNTALYRKQTGSGNTGWSAVANNIDITFGAAGAQVVGGLNARWYAPRACTISAVRASVNTAPTGSTLIVDVNKNGTTMYTTQANRPAIAISGNTVAAALPDIVSLAAGDYVQVDVDQIGSTVAGSDLTVQIAAYY